MREGKREERERNKSEARALLYNLTRERGRGSTVVLVFYGRPDGVFDRP